MILISLCPLPNYIFTFKWASFVRILAGVRTFYYETKTSSVYKCLQASTVFPVNFLTLYPLLLKKWGYKEQNRGTKQKN